MIEDKPYFSGVVSETKTIATATTTNYTGAPIPEGVKRVVHCQVAGTRTNGTVDSLTLQISMDGSNWAAAATDTTGWTADFDVLLTYEFPIGAAVRLVVVTSGATVDWDITSLIASADV